MSKSRIVIVGGGFGGVQCAKVLSRNLRRENCEIVLFDRENHLVFSPLLAEVVGSSINALDTIVPLRQLLTRVFCRTEEVRAVISESNEVEYVSEDGTPQRMHYDHLVLACGSTTNLHAVPGMADHSFPLKTLADASTLRSHIIEAMEKAEVARPERRKWYLTFLIVGGGFSGVEAAGEINDLVRSTAKYYHNWKAEDVQVILIHSRDHILPEITPKLRQFAQRKMKQAGVTFILNARVDSATPEGVGLEDGRFLRGATIVCTIGSSPAPVTSSFKVEREKGRLVTEADLRLKAHANIWAVGDCAWIVNARTHEPSPPTGQFAERQGRQCAENICRVLRKEPTRAFSFKPLGELSSIGGHSAVAEILGFQLSGFLAWFVWRGVYLFKLPTIGRRLQVGFDWAWLLVFPRDLAHMRNERTDRVTQAHYDTGNMIFRQGEAPTNFYVLKRGEVEVLRSLDGSPPEVIALLGPGSFFGEQALMGDRPRMMSVRARTPVDVLVMGKNVFTQVSGALAPFKDALAQTLNRRSTDVWKGRQDVYELLQGTAVRQLMDPVPLPLLKPTSSLRDAARMFVDHGSEFIYVSADGTNLDGVLTISDLLRGGAGRSQTAVSGLMTRTPVTIAPEDNCAVAVNALREYRLKNLPVVEKGDGKKLVGALRIRRVMGFVLQELPA